MMMMMMMVNDDDDIYIMMKCLKACLFWLVSMVFQGDFLVFHGLWLVSRVFQGGFMVFHGFVWFPWFIKVVSLFSMVFGWFP